MWKCPKCGTPIEPSFDVCWACGTSAEGVEDPNFVTADEAEPIYEPRSEAAKADLAVEAELPEPPAEVVECYRAASTAEAKFLIDRLAEQGIPAMIQGAKAGGLGYLVPSLSPRIMVRAHDLFPARHLIEDYERRRQLRQSTDD